jgi:hypothetical protein
MKMNLEKILKTVSIVQAHPDMMTSEQISKWFSVLRTLESVRIYDPDGATHLRCAHGAFQGKFSIHFGTIARMDVTLTQVYPGSKKYSVTSVTKYYNGTMSQHGTKEYNTLQREVLRQQELFQQQQRESAHRAIEHHQMHVQQHMQHVHQHHVMMHHHHNF